MGQARRWERVALSGLVAASLCLGFSGPALAADAGVDVLDWNVTGSVEAGGIYTFGQDSSAKFEKYRDMDSGFIGELELRGENKNQPYFFELGLKNPTRTDQWYEGAFGRYGMFRLDLFWNETPYVLSNTAATIYQLNGDTFTLPASNRAQIATIFTTAPTTPAGRAAINTQINGLLRPVSLGFNTDVGGGNIKYTPIEDLRFDIEYKNIHNEGTRPIGAQMAGSTAGPIDELAIPVDNFTNEVTAGAEYAKANWGLRFYYTGSFFNNQFTGYTWDNPIAAVFTPAANAFDRVTAAPDNYANTFNLTGTAALPLRTRLNGTFAYTMLRQDQAFELSTQNPLIPRTQTDDAGRGSPDANSNLVLANIVLTSRPITTRTAGLDTMNFTARYKYFEYQNNMPQHVFTNDVYTGGGTTTVSATSQNERFTIQNVGIDVGYHPISMLNLKAGYAYLHVIRADYGDLGDTGATQPNFADAENIGRFSADVTPVDWFLGRLTYTYANRTITGYNANPIADLPGSIKYNYASRVGNRVDALFQFSPWETFSPSFSVGYAVNDYPSNTYGLLKDNYFNTGVNLDWTPVKWLTVSGDYTYERYNYNMASRYLPGGTFPGIPDNNWNTNTEDEYQNIGLSATVTVVPKKFIVNLGYFVNFGYTTFDNWNPSPSAATASPNATAFPWDRVYNVLQTFRISGKYYLTDKLSVRGSFAYEHSSERNWATDPMQPFMGNFDSTTSPAFTPTAQGVQSVWLGARNPNYTAYIIGGAVRYDF